MWENFKQIFKIVLQALLTNKVRSFLTMLGIIIGVAAVILIVSLGSGAQKLVLSQLDSFGSDMIAVMPGQANTNGPPASAFGAKITSLKTSDAQALAKPENLPYVVSVTAYYDASVTAYYQNNSVSTTLQGVNGDYFQMSKLDLLAGRYLTPEEIDSNLALVVLGNELSEELFGQSDPIGKRIKLNNRQAQVIGVLAKKGMSGFSSPDKNIFAPLAFVQKEIAGIDYLSGITIKVDNEDNIDESLVIIASILRERHKIDQLGDEDFSVRSFLEALELVTTVTNAFSYFLAAMAALSLLVGGIGIMNIMLVSVRERTREIGLRKALGAQSNQIRAQFLLEAVTLTLFGGVLGVLVGTFLSYLVSIIVSYLGYKWVFSISVLASFIALLISALIGILFGYYPAKKASQLEPITALRYE